MGKEKEINDRKETPNMAELETLILKNGFELAGITEANIPIPDQKNIQEFISKKFYASMNWFPDRQNIRIGFENLGFPVASILMLAVIYKPKEEDEVSYLNLKDKISRYAWGEDYHKVLRDKAQPILDYLRESFPGKKFRQGIDSLPIAEKILAREAGLGWIGKNTLLINENLGSYFFLTAILSEVNLAEEFNEFPINEESIFSNHIAKDRCGSCTACLDACPTQAIVAPYQLDANQCISHHTIEYTEEEFTKGMKTHGWVFGCDICQEVCPWNRIKATKKGISTKEERFRPLEIWKEDRDSWQKLDSHQFEDAFNKSPILRTGYRSWLRNLKAGEKKIRI